MLPAGVLRHLAKASQSRGKGIVFSGNCHSNSRGERPTTHTYAVEITKAP